MSINFLTPSNTKGSGLLLILKNLTWPFNFSGGDKGIRTPDLCDANAALSQLSYIPIKSLLIIYYSYKTCFYILLQSKKYCHMHSHYLLWLIYHSFFHTITSLFLNIFPFFRLLSIYLLLKYNY